MNNLLSIIIPSFKREDLLRRIVFSLEESFKKINFLNYEIVLVKSGVEETREEKNIGKVKVLEFEERLDPGIARNRGINSSSSEWVWFVDDDDEISEEKLKGLIDLISLDCNYSLIAHSLTNRYEGIEAKKNLIEKILLFREKQEVFNFVFRRKVLEDNSIIFSSGVHEDIRYVAQILSHSENIGIVNEKIYNKNFTEDSITKKLTSERIEGYVKFLKEIVELNDPNIRGIQEQIIVQCLGTILYLINKSEEKEYFLDVLDMNFPEFLKLKIKKKYTTRDSNFKYAVSLFLESGSREELIEDLDYCFRSYLSCKDLKNSLFLGPTEIIGCCKRFFYNGKMKGDIVLMPNSSGITLESIIEKKKEVEYLINTESYEECEGCPYLQRFEKKEEEKIDYISLENFTYCNMRCTYCSPKYYGGKESEYETIDIIEDLISGDQLGEKTHVVWGGGEPTLKPKFDSITEKLLDSEKVSIIRVLTNSLRFSPHLEKILKSEKIRVVTSIDSGTRDKFKKIRGKGEIRKVFENLKKYSGEINSPENLTIKYIFTEDNLESTEIDGFIHLLKEFELQHHFIQISCNFYLETPPKEIIFAIYELAGKLLASGFDFVYFDDLIRDRLKISTPLADQILEFLESKNIRNEKILSYKSEKEVILWGKGYQSNWIKSSTSFGSSGKIIKVISDESDLESSDLSEGPRIICPSAIQSLPDIYRQIKNSNLFNNFSFVIFV